MWDSRLEQLFSQLSEKEYKTADNLAQTLGVSNKTVRTRMKELEKVLEASGAAVKMQRGAGFRLEIVSDHFYQNLGGLKCREQRSQYLSLPENRMQYLLEYLLNRKGYVTMDDLSESFYVSRKTLASDLKSLEQILKRYHLKLLRKPNHGIKIEGDEFDVRLCMANSMLHSKVSGLSETENEEENQIIEEITLLVEQVLNQEEICISDVMLQNLVIHIYIAIRRMEEKNYVPIESVPLENWIGNKAYKAAKEIAARLYQTFQIPFAESEIQYIAIHLSGKQYFEPAEGNLVISQEVGDLVTEMLERVFEAFRFDFREDLELRMTLSQHIMPLVVRLQYGMKIQNPMLREIKERFSLAFAMAAHAGTVLIKTCQTIPKEEEIGYLALAFALAIERQRTEIVKKNILLVCASGMGSAKLLQYRYEELFGRYIDRIETCDAGQLGQMDFTGFDYIFSTVPISVHVPIPIQEVTYFLGEGDIQKIKRYLTIGSDCLIQGYFSPDLFLPHMEAASKEEAIKEITGFVQEREQFPDEFYHAVMERENLAQTAFGNQVAMPHPNYTISEHTFVCVGILKEPIAWGDFMVNVIFLVSIGRQKDKNLKMFYRIVSEYLLRPEHMNRLIKNRDYEEMIQQLQQIELQVGKEEK